MPLPIKPELPPLTGLYGRILLFCAKMLIVACLLFPFGWECWRGAGQSPSPGLRAKDPWRESLGGYLEGGEFWQQSKELMRSPLERSHHIPSSSWLGRSCGAPSLTEPGRREQINDMALSFRPSLEEAVGCGSLLILQECPLPHPRDMPSPPALPARSFSLPMSFSLGPQQFF